MPNHFQFIDRKTNEAVMLDEIDRRIAEAAGQEYSPETYCTAYQFITLLGQSILIWAGDSDEITKQAFEGYKMVFPTIATNWEIVERFLVTDYRYVGWATIGRGT